MFLHTIHHELRHVSTYLNHLYGVTYHQLRIYKNIDGLLKMALGSTQILTEINIRNISWD